MKVKELIEELGYIDPEANILCYVDARDLMRQKNAVVEITTVNTTDAEKCHTEDGETYMDFNPSDTSQPYVVFETTSI